MFEKEAEEIANKKLCSERICYNHCNFNSPTKYKNKEDNKRLHITLNVNVEYL